MLASGPENTLGGGLLRLAQLAASVHRYESAMAMTPEGDEIENDEYTVKKGQNIR